MPRLCVPDAQQQHVPGKPRSVTSPLSPRTQGRSADYHTQRPAVSCWAWGPASKQGSPGSAIPAGSPGSSAPRFSRTKQLVSILEHSPRPMATTWNRVIFAVEAVLDPFKQPGVVTRCPPHALGPAAALGVPPHRSVLGHLLTSAVTNPTRFLKSARGLREKSKRDWGSGMPSTGKG